jgi:hypothetical protein
MTKILIDRAVVEQALHVATGAGYPVALVAALKAALAEAALQRLTDVSQEIEAALAEPVAAVAKNATAQFDHAIGADRFKVVRGAFWWHVLIGDSTKEHGKFSSRAGADQMAADLLREFRNGAFVQHTAPPTLRAALVEPVLNPAPGYCKHCKQYTIEEPLPAEPVQGAVQEQCKGDPGECEINGGCMYACAKPEPLYAAPPQRKPLVDPAEYDDAGAAERYNRGLK